MLKKRLGSGGMGRVYEAADAALDRRVAVKLIRNDLLGSTEAAERFKREARIAAGFVHPNVVTVHDFGLSQPGRAFLVMELLEGVTLRQHLRERKRLEVRRAIEILRGVCSALESAHRRQLVHRDLKPENIFLAGTDAGEVVKVLDFGIAKSVVTVPRRSDFDTGRGVLLGTPRYMAPEQLRGETAHPAWDTWAIAVIAYEMLTGAHPSAPPGGLTSRGTDAIGGRFSPVGAHLPGAPRSWQGFFERALALEPERRPRSPGSFFSEVERVLTMES